MSSPHYRWWGFARKMIRDYPALKKNFDDLHEQSITANISGLPRGGGVGRTVEQIALKQLPPDDQKAFDAVDCAVRLTRALKDGKDRLSVIRFIYWYQKPHTVKDAALHCYVSKRTAERWHADFVRMVGKCYGFDVVVGREPK